MALDLVALTLLACADPMLDVGIHAWPNKTLRERLLSGPNSGMGEGVNRVENALPEGGRNKRTWRIGREVAEQLFGDPREDETLELESGIARQGAGFPGLSVSHGFIADWRKR